MEQIGAWLKPIIAMVILGGFFELILPDNQLKSVTKMILGLIIMMFLLQPLARMMLFPAALSGMAPGVIAKNIATTNTDQVIREGLKMRNVWLQDYEAKAQKDWDAKLERIIGLFEGVTLQNVDCDYDGLKLTKVKLVVRPVAPVKIRSGKLEQLHRKILQTVQLFTDLKPEQIEVRWGEPNE